MNTENSIITVDDAVAEPDGRVLLAVAARIGRTRLIDNATIDLRQPAATGTTAGADHAQGAP